MRIAMEVGPVIRFNGTSGAYYAGLIYETYGRVLYGTKKYGYSWTRAARYEDIDIIVIDDPISSLDYMHIYNVMSKIKELQIYNCDYIMNTQMVQTPYIVEKMIYQGLYILAGAPKIGKSWLALELCLSVAEGRQFLKHETNCGQALYLSLEDSLLRI